MKQYILKLSCIALAIFSISSCTKEEMKDDTIKISFEHPNTTKVTDTGFEQDDKVGLYITTSDAILQGAGNYVNNNMLTYDGADWNPAQAMYWNNGTYNVYAYYPYMSSIESVTDLPFSVSLEQNEIDNYMASDFLWASVEGVSASSLAVNMTFSHRMSRIYMKLVPGEDYSGEIPEDAQVFVHNLIADATVDLSVGIVTLNDRAESKTIQARNMGNNCYSAIVIPQRISSRVPLVEVIMDGVSYLYESSFLFKRGVQHNVNLVVSKNPSQIKIEIGGEIGGWSE
jgi:hypothetical protein